jgi:CubicO group peptidase (beta-lactamase class C family)
MTHLAAKIADITSALETLAKQYKVPGASLGVMSGDETIEIVTGVANVDTGLPVTNDTMFQIGSNTKVFTATLVMLLVDEGKVDLDAPFHRYLPDVKLGDPKALQQITVRQLITHTNGIDAADYFEDFGMGDESLERFVTSLAPFGQIYPPGDMWSYCNSGFALAGLLIEKLTGDPFRKVLHDRLLTPLGMSRTTVRVEDMLVRSSAAGHITAPGSNEPIVTPTPLLPICTTAAGAITASTPKDMFTFVRMHLDGGKGPGGKRFLSEASAKAMQQPQAKLPASSLGEAMGVGWILSNWDGERVIGHGGGTVGQYSFLQVMPDRRFGVVLLTNGSGGGLLWRDLGRFLFEEFAGVKMPDVPKAPDDPPKLDLARYAGVYSRLHMDTELKVKDGRLVGTVKYTGPLQGVDDADEFGATPLDESIFVMESPDGDTLAEFMEFDRNGRPRYLHLGGRVSRRADGGPSKKAKPRKKTKAKARPRRR